MVVVVESPLVPAPNFRGDTHMRRPNAAGSRAPTHWAAGGLYAAFFATLDISLPGKSRARSSEAIPIKKHTTLASNSFRCVRRIVRNNLVAMLSCTHPPHNKSIHRV